LVFSETRGLALMKWLGNKARHETERSSVTTANAHKTRQYVKVPSLCVPVRSIMETALSWHIQGQRLLYPVRGL
jgi:hypothetical protein